MRLGEYPALIGMATRSPAAARQKTDLPTFSPDLMQEGHLLLKLGIGKPVIARMMLRAKDNGNTVEAELLVSGEIDERLYFEALADRLGLPFLPEIDARRVHDGTGLDTQLVTPEVLRIHYPDRPPTTVIVPKLSRLDDIATMLRRRPHLRAIMAVSTPSAVRAAAWQGGRSRRAERTVNGLFDATPLHSARVVFWGKQGFFAGVALSCVIVTAVLAPFVWMLAMHVMLTGFYFAHFLLRFRALCFSRSPLPAPAPAPSDAAPLPVYTIMVALYREKEVAAQLVGALDRLDWPRALLDIKLVCEEDDAETIAALSAQALGPEYEIVRVPPCAPRTKPKALGYALPAARGRYVTVYDAEDRPDPQQLREAHAAFLAAPPEIACFQSPLVVTNARHAWLSALFALEYSALFRGLLPFLSSAGLPLPLGGTSNHFLTCALKEVGGWDPFNTTEDADLGLRLHRLGYRSQMLVRPTYEDAPVRPRDWFGQRTRWFKGWLQTWLVLMRAPLLLRDQIGWKAFAVFQILIAGMLMSALGHPFILAFMAYLGWILIVQDASLGTTALAGTLFVIDILNIAGSYAVMIGLGVKTMARRERQAIGRAWAAVPLYWLMISAAAWAALVELHRKPFAWNKTPHRPVVGTGTGI